MNERLQKFARDELKAGLATCTEGQQRLFKQMYAHGKMHLPIDAAVDAMPEDKLSWVMDQVQKTLDKKTSRTAKEPKSE